MQESKTLHYILGISLVMIAVFVVASLVMVNSQADNATLTIGVNQESPTVQNWVLTNTSNGNTNIPASTYTLPNNNTGTNAWIIANVEDLDGGLNDMAFFDFAISRSDQTDLTFTAPVNLQGCFNNGGTPGYNCISGTTTGGSPMCTAASTGNSTYKVTCGFVIPPFYSYTAGGNVSAFNALTNNVTIIVRDKENNSDRETMTREVNSTLAVNFANYNINFGTHPYNYESGTETSPGTNILGTTWGNVGWDATLTMDSADFTCANSTTLPVSNTSTKVYAANASVDAGWGGAGTLPNSNSGVKIEFNTPVRTSNTDTQKMLGFETSYTAAGYTGKFTGPCDVTGTLNFQQDDAI